MHHLLTLFLIYLQLADLTFLSEASEPYCIYNKTEYTYIKVNKTREIKLTKPWYKKLSKDTTKVEYYEEEEAVPKVTPIKECCEGYEMSVLQLCEPKCAEGCPENSKCVEPEICKCKPGYFSALSEHDGKHYCQPICNTTCPEHSTCVRPNECACRTGYRPSQRETCEPFCASGCSDGECIAPNQCICHSGYELYRGTCRPKCTIGNHCQNGICKSEYECHCNFGFVFNLETQSCEPNLNMSNEDENSDEEMTTELYTSENPEYELDDYVIHTSEAYDYMYDSNDAANKCPDGFVLHRGRCQPSEVAHKCPDDFVLYRGHCQPLKFAIDEIDCRVQPCTDPQAICTNNGTCACREGYKSFKKPIHADSTEYPQYLVKPVCLSPEQLAALDNDNQNGGELEIVSIVFIVLGVLIMVGALIYLVLRLVCAQKGQLDVEGNQLSCTYDTRVCTDAEKSVI